MGEGLLEQDDDDAGFCMRTRRLMSGARVCVGGMRVVLFKKEKKETRKQSVKGNKTTTHHYLLG